jgi:hydroxyacylglutathione hydrolase
LTHAHLDHVGAVEFLRRRAGIPVYLHADDAPLLAAVPQQARLFGLDAAPVAPAERTLAAGDLLEVGRLQLRILHTPGHSPGGVCLYSAQENVLIAGDTLFRRGFGRTDLPGGDAAELLRSIETQLWPLPDNTVVLPGHGGRTTIGEERRFNPIAELSNLEEGSR